MDDNKNQNKYQDILNQYADQINSDPKKTNDQPKNEEQKSLKDINSLQLEAPDPVLEISSNNPSDKPEPQPEPIADLKEEIPQTPILEPTPDINEVKSQVDEILNYQTRSDNPDESVAPIETENNSSNIPKILFFVSLFIFIGIISTLVYFLTSGSKSTDTTKPIPTVSPTSTEVACSINGLSLGIGESFKAADGCNTCSCTAPDVIACTEMACEATPTAKVSSATKSATVSPTKSATTSSIPKDWKTYTDKELGFSFNYPKNITLTKKSSNGTFSLAINTQVSLAGGVNMITGITVNRGGSSLDFGGYTKNGNQITYFYNKDKSTVCDSKLIKKIYNNPNGLEIVLLEGTISEELAGPCETSSGEIKALINIKNKTYPGLTFINNSLITESDLMKILDTLKFN